MNPNLPQVDSMDSALPRLKKNIEAYMNRETDELDLSLAEGYLSPSDTSVQEIIGDCLQQWQLGRTLSLIEAALESNLIQDKVSFAHRLFVNKWFLLMAEYIAKSKLNEEEKSALIPMCIAGDGWLEGRKLVLEALKGISAHSSILDVMMAPFFGLNEYDLPTLSHNPAGRGYYYLVSLKNMYDPSSLSDDNIKALLSGFKFNEERKAALWTGLLQCTSRPRNLVSAFQQLS
jgi:hypothetical protein